MPHSVSALADSPAGIPIQDWWLRTPRLLIRPLRLADAPAWHACRSAMPFDPQTRTLAQSVAQVQAMQRRPSLMAPGWQQFALLAANGELVGDFGVAFEDPGPGQAMLGFAMMPAWRGQGLAMEAGAALLERLFGQGLRRVAAITDIRNLAAQRLLGHLGFRQEAHYRQSWWDGASWQDELGYARLASD
ncbi:GNAT family N-acetyltransferase [Polymorphobacter sp.]|uniref:GNAT family N-acetyltransferase n=1 Tax=Polymorphobacter sp. TaxID=1909290 RepID=UPI003F70ACC5